MSLRRAILADLLSGKRLMTTMMAVSMHIAVNIGPPLFRWLHCGLAHNA